MTTDIRIADCRDDDNRVLEVTVSGNAAWIVTGDRDLLALDFYCGIRIGTPRQFNDMLDAMR